MQLATVAVQLRGSLTGEMSAAVLEALAYGVPVLTNLASAAEYPEATVALLGELTPEATAGCLASLIADPAGWLRSAGPGRRSPRPTSSRWSSMPYWRPPRARPQPLPSWGQWFFPMAEPGIPPPRSSTSML
jgi:hypothetical protein